jgi:hypothetical protein
VCGDADGRIPACDGSLGLSVGVEACNASVGGASLGGASLGGASLGGASLGASVGGASLGANSMRQLGPTDNDVISNLRFYFDKPGPAILFAKLVPSSTEADHRDPRTCRIVRTPLSLHLGPHTP